MQKLFIILTLVLGVNIFAFDTIDIVKEELWQQYEESPQRSSLSIELQDKWSEEIEFAVKVVEEL